MKYVLPLVVVLAGCVAAPMNPPLPPPGMSSRPASMVSLDGSSLSSLNIAGARSLFIGGKAGATGYRMAALQETEMYRANPDGTITKVEAMNSAGQVAPYFHPRYMVRLNETYLFLLTGMGTYLVRTSDGKSARLDPMGYGSWDESEPAPAAADQTGHIYFVSNGVLYKVKTPEFPATPTATESVVKTTLNNPDFERVGGSPIVDAAGNVLITVYNSSGGRAIPRLYKAAGGVKNLSAEGGSFWLGANGKFYAFAPIGGVHGVHEITVEPTGEVTTALIPDCPMPMRPVNMADRTVAIKGVNTLLFIQERTFSTVSLQKVAQISRLYASATKVFVLGKDVDGKSLLVKYDPATGEETVAFQSEDYQIFKLALASNEEVTLSVLRFADNTYGIGTVAPGGDLVFLNGTVAQVQDILPLQ